MSGRTGIFAGVETSFADVFVVEHPVTANKPPRRMLANFHACPITSSPRQNTC